MRTIEDRYCRYNKTINALKNNIDRNQTKKKEIQGRIGSEWTDPKWFDSIQILWNFVKSLTVGNFFCIDQFFVIGYSGELKTKERKKESTATKL